MMATVKYPRRTEWPALCKRPFMAVEDVWAKVETILGQVKEEGDPALFRLTEKFDSVSLNEISVPVVDTDEVTSGLKDAIRLAMSNIERFHSVQRQDDRRIETRPGVTCWRRSIPIQRVGIYIPGGSAPLFSTLLMLGIPARLAGCAEIVVCTPPNKGGVIDPAIMFTAHLIGMKELYTVGGAQAIAAMAYGTESIPKVDKIFGPGNQFVTVAKQLVQLQGVSIDIPAGPSELLVIADECCNPAFVAADLLAQAEHGPDSQVLLVTDSEKVVEQVQENMGHQLEALPRRGIAAQALANSKAVLVKDKKTAMEFSNAYAPEHLVLATADPDELAEEVVNAGSVFLGNYSGVSAGDYASGTNHTLPTNGYARNYSGVSLESFEKKVTYQQLSPKGILNIGPAIELMAAAEGLEAHKNAISIRLKELENV